MNYDDGDDDDDDDDVWCMIYDTWCIAQYVVYDI